MFDVAATGVKRSPEAFENNKSLMISGVQHLYVIDASMSSHGYEPLIGHPSKENHLASDAPYYNTVQNRPLTQAWRIRYILLTVLCTSLMANVLLISKLYEKQNRIYQPSFLGLERNVERTITHNERTIDDPVWDMPEFQSTIGFVALDSQFMKTKGLPTSMHWPWDDSKSIFLLHGFHSLHCVYVVRDAIQRYHTGDSQIWPFAHVTHCLNTLREDTTCNADDTPRYTGRLHAQENKTIVHSGIGQTRKCRDWSRLRQYALEHSACYYRPTDHYIPLLDRYKTCPDGSRPWEREDD